MSTGAKLVLALIVLIVLWFLYDSYKKRQGKEEKKCIELDHTDWTIKLREKKNQIYSREMIIYADTSLPMATRTAYYEKWKTEALSEEGIQDSWKVVEYGAAIEAEQELLKEGYCKP